MPRSASPPKGPRRRSPSPRRDQDHNYDRDRPSAKYSDRPRSRSRSPPRSSNYTTKRPKELSMYKKSSYPSGGARRDYNLDEPAESGRERMERRDRGEVPGRYGGTREAGVRNTMSLYPPGGSGSGGASASVGSLKRTVDPLDRLGVKGSHGGGDHIERDNRGRGDDGGSKSGPAIHPDRRQSVPTAGSKPAATTSAAPPMAYSRLIEVIANDRMGRKVRVKCSPTDTVGDLKRLIAAQTGTVPSKIQLKKWYNIFKDHVSLQDYEIHDGMSLEMY